MSAGNALHFLDTNVLVYAHDVAAGAKRPLARDLLENLWLSGRGCLSIQVLQEFYITVTRKIKHPLVSDEAAAVISYLGQWRVHSPVAADVLAAIDLAGRHHLSCWDAAIIVSAQRLGCALLWSEDLQDGMEFGGVRIRNPFKPEALVQEDREGYKTAEIQRRRGEGKNPRRSGG